MLSGTSNRSLAVSPVGDERLPQVHVAMLGSRRNYAVPRLLHEAGVLGKFYTDIYLGDKSWLEKFLKVIPAPIRPVEITRLLGRRGEAIPGDRVVSFDLLGLRFWWWYHTAPNTAARVQVYAQAARAFNQRVICQMLDRADLIWGFNGAALELFQYARGRGINSILEQTIVPRAILRKLLLEEAERWPNWQPGLVLSSASDSLSEREEVEWSLAERIAAGSDFVVEGLVACGVDEQKCCVVPYGVDLHRFTATKRQRRGATGRLRVLFAGAVGLRKGAPYLLEALRKIGPKGVEARFAGKNSLAPQKCQDYAAVAQFLGAVPRIQMPALFQWADVFVLPSICEGSSVATYEALASGLPVVATPNCGSVVRDGVDGHIVPVRDAEAIAQVLDHYIEDPDYLVAQQQVAENDRDRVGLGVYRDNLLRVITHLHK